MFAGGVCGGEVPGGSVRRFLGYCLRHLLHKSASALLSYSSVFHMET